MDDPDQPGARFLEIAQRDVVRVGIGHGREYRTHL
jgi:hypothetical protein